MYETVVFPSLGTDDVTPMILSGLSTEVKRMFAASVFTEFCR